MPLYNCRHSGDQYKITKFDSDWNVEASYLCDLTACECPAGHRPKCRHREMLPKFIQRGHVGDEWFYDHDRGGWVQGASREIEPSLTLISIDEIEDESQYDGDIPGTEDSLTIATEITLPADSTPDEVAEAFGNLLAPIGLEQASDLEANLSASNEELIAQAEPLNLQQPSPSPIPTIRRRV